MPRGPRRDRPSYAHLPSDVHPPRRAWPPSGSASARRTHQCALAARTASASDAPLLSCRWASLSALTACVAPGVIPTMISLASGLTHSNGAYWTVRWPSRWMLKAGCVHVSVEVADGGCEAGEEAVVHWVIRCLAVWLTTWVRTTSAKCWLQCWLQCCSVGVRRRMAAGVRGAMEQ